MTRTLRLIIIGLLSAMLALSMTTTSAVAAPSTTGRAAPTASCVSAQQRDAGAAADVSQAEAKYKKAKKVVHRAAKTYKKSATAQHKRALKKAKKKKNKAKASLASAKANRTASSNAFIVYCGTTPTGTPAPAATPGVSPLAPLCATASALQPLCDATDDAGSTSPLQPLCAAITQLAPLCAVDPGDLADPAAVTALLDQIEAALPQDTTSLLALVDSIVSSLLQGDLQGVATALQTTPAALDGLIGALLGITIPTIPGLPVTLP